MAVSVATEGALQLPSDDTVARLSRREMFPWQCPMGAPDVAMGWRAELVSQRPFGWYLIK